MASILKVDKLDPQSGTALELGTSGDTISVPSGATLDISASTLTPPATMPASSGINFTALNATNLGSGTVAIARGGTGAATFAAAGLANTPNFVIEQDAITAIPTSTRTKVELDLAVIDTDSGLDATNKRWVVPADKGGTYFVAYGTQFNSAAGFGANVGIWKNGGYTQSVWGNNDTYSYQNYNGSFMIALVPTDYLELFAWQSSGSTHSTVTSDAGIQTFMAGFRLL